MRFLSLLLAIPATLELALSAVRFRTLLRTLPPSVFDGALPEVLTEGERALVGKVRVASRVLTRLSFGRVECLASAVAVHVFLSKRGIRSIIRVGVVPGDFNQFQGHAWVEVAPDVIVGSRLSGDRVFEKSPQNRTKPGSLGQVSTPR